MDETFTKQGQRLKNYNLKHKDDSFQKYSCRFALEQKGLKNIENGMTNNTSKTLNSQMRHIKRRGEEKLAANNLVKSDDGKEVVVKKTKPGHVAVFCDKEEDLSPELMEASGGLVAEQAKYYKTTGKYQQISGVQKNLPTS